MDLQLVSLIQLLLPCCI